MTTLTISYYGLSCFAISAKTGNDTVNIVCDPYDTKETGLKLPRTMDADILTITSNKPLHNNVSAVNKPGMTINEPGEYEKSGVFVYGIPTESGVIYRFEFEDLVLVHLGGLAHTLTSSELEKLENVDILLLPVGGGDMIDYKKAVDAANQIEPRVIVPMNYKMPSLNVELDIIDKFLKEYGAKTENMPKLKIASKDLPQEDTRVIVLEKA